MRPSRSIYRARVDHASAAEAARAKPGRWVRAGAYPSSSSAKNAARDVRTAERVPAYAPAYAFRASVRPETDGYALWVVYVAEDGSRRRGRPPKAAPDKDIVRVLGQIRRGDVVAGPEGARRIAARYEAACGDVWARRLVVAAAPVPADDEQRSSPCVPPTVSDPKGEA